MGDTSDLPFICITIFCDIWRHRHLITIILSNGRHSLLIIKTEIYLMKATNFSGDSITITSKEHFAKIFNNADISNCNSGDSASSIDIKNGMITVILRDIIYYRCITPIVILGGISFWMYMIARGG